MSCYKMMNGNRGKDRVQGIRVSFAEAALL